MKERPIVLSSSEVRQILDGRKTRLSRAITPQPPWQTACMPFTLSLDPALRGTSTPLDCEYDGVWPTKHECGPPVRCPYGLPGDRLWVRESWAGNAWYNGLDPVDIPDRHQIWYRADGRQEVVARGRWRAAITMPRWASRLALEVTKVRAQRLWEASEADARAEGFSSDPQSATINGEPGKAWIFDPIKWLLVEWDKHYGKTRELCASGNPWVWVVDFEVAWSFERA